MKRFLLNYVFILLVTNASAQDITIKAASNKLHDIHSLVELDTISHSEDAEGNFYVNIKMQNGAVYTFNVDDVTETYTESRDDVLRRGRYADMVYAKSFKSVSELNKGDLIGVFSESDYSTSEFVDAVYKNLANYGIGSISSLFTGSVSANVTLLALQKLVPSSSIRFHVVDIAYVGADIDGSNIPLSARLIYPYGVGNRFSLSGVCIDNHVTVFERNQEPSSMFSPFSLAGLSSKGNLVIQPDLLGYGISDNRSQMYVDRDINGSGVAYSLVAATQYAEIAADKEDGFTLSPDASVTNYGSSQGASTALHGTYFIENKLDKRVLKGLPKLTDTHVCAGAYDMKLAMDAFCSDDTLTYSCKLPMFLAGAVIAHSDAIRDPEGKPYKVTDFFNPALSDVVFTNVFGKTGNLWQLIDYKTQFEGIFARYFGSPVAPQRGSFAKIIARDMYKPGSDGRNVLDLDNPKVKALGPILAMNDLTNPDMWIPQSDITMIHGDNDEIIPYACSTKLLSNMSQSMKQRGHTCTLKTLNDVPAINVNFGPHMISCFVWIISELTGISVDLVYPLLKSQIGSMQM